MYKKGLAAVLGCFVVLFSYLVRENFFAVLWWWACLEIIGLLFLPVSRRLFPQFLDGGFFLSKGIGLTFLSVGTFFLSSLLYLRLSLLLILAVFILLRILVNGRYGYRCLLRLNRIWLWEMALSLLVLLVACYVRGLNASISDLEKFMDFGLVNAVLRADHMPPMDMWYAGEQVNYYYFGHFATAMLIKLTGIRPEIGYNLMIAGIFAQGCLTVGGLSANMMYRVSQKLKKSLLAGFLSALMTFIGGNLHAFIYGVALPLLNRLKLYRPNETLSGYWFPDATRYIGYNPPTQDMTIHEFPFYSYIVSDLHAHYLNIIFVTAFLGVLMRFFYREQAEEKTGIPKLVLSMEELILGLLLGVMAMTNTWDYPIYSVFLMLVMLAKWLMGVRSFEQLKTLFFSGFRIAMVSLLSAAPMLLQFQNFSQGIGFVSARTPLYQLLVLWGHFLILGIIFALMAFGGLRKRKLSAEGATASCAFDRLALIGWAMGVLLLIVPEVIYIVDITGPEYHRANTMFKFTYQAFIIFGTMSGYMAVRCFEMFKSKWEKLLLGPVIIAAFLLPTIYPYFAVKGRYGSVLPQNYHGIDGLAYLEEDPLSDYYRAIQWLNDHVSGQTVILEADGTSFSRNGIVSMATGLPTVLGWYQHEWLWRGNPDGSSARSSQASQVYTATSLDLIRPIVEQYDIAYIVIGDQERERFPEMQEEVLDRTGTVVFTSNNLKIIKVSRAKFLIK